MLGLGDFVEGKLSMIASESLSWICPGNKQSSVSDPLSSTPNPHRNLALDRHDAVCNLMLVQDGSVIGMP